MATTRVSTKEKIRSPGATSLMNSLLRQAHAFSFKLARHKTGFALRWHCASATRDNPLRSPVDMSGFDLPTSSARCSPPVFHDRNLLASIIALGKLGDSSGVADDAA